MTNAAVLSAEPGYGFEPDAARVGVLDGKLREQLRESVQYLAGQLAAHVSVSPERLAAFSSRLEAGPLPPLAYAVYSDLVLAIDTDDLNGAERLFNRLLADVPHPTGVWVRDLGDGMAAEDAERYARYAESGGGLRLDLVRPSARASRECRREIQAALALLDSEDPALAGEMRRLVHEIVLCQNGPASPGVRFDGSSNFMLWGAVVINAETRRNRPTTVQVLAHESAHNLLFALCPDQPLVNNDPQERYTSALRKDPRPMEGIYHAAFVCARMHRALANLAASPALSPPERVEARAAMEKSARAFRQGMATVDEHADLTEPGRAIIENARAYMAAR